MIITAAATEFEPQASGGSAGIGGGGAMGSGILGGLLGASLNRAHMALDIRIVDASTSEVLTATRVQGQASDVGSDWRLFRRRRAWRRFGRLRQYPHGESDTCLYHRSSKVYFTNNRKSV